MACADILERPPLPGDCAIMRAGSVRRRDTDRQGHVGNAVPLCELAAGLAARFDLGGADGAAEIDVRRAIAQGTRLAAMICTRCQEDRA